MDKKALVDKMADEIATHLMENNEHWFEVNLTDLRYATNTGMQAICEALEKCGYVITDEEDKRPNVDVEGRTVLACTYARESQYVEVSVGGFVMVKQRNGKIALLVDEDELELWHVGQLLFKGQ